MNDSALWVVAGEGAGLQAGVPDGAGAAGLKKYLTSKFKIFARKVYESICRIGTVMDSLN